MRKLNSQDFALLSDHVYGKKDKGGVIRLAYDNGDEKKREITLSGITYKVEQVRENPQSGYFGAVYRRLDNNEIIVAHRGTEFGTRQDREADMRMIRDRTNPQYRDAAILTESANAIAKRNGVPIYQTGHSLGGTLAQLCGYKYGHQTHTYNAYGAAELTEARGISNPNARQLITNHRMGGDFVAAASAHLGREIVYTTPAEIRNLKNGGFGNGNPNDNTYLDSTIPAWFSIVGAAATAKGPAVGLYSSHRITNFTDEGGLSVLSPNSKARQLAQENAALLEEFRRDVQKTAKEAPEKFEKLFDMVGKYIAENRQPDFREQQNQQQYARAPEFELESASRPFDLSSAASPYAPYRDETDMLFNKMFDAFTSDDPKQIQSFYAELHQSEFMKEYKREVAEYMEQEKALEQQQALEQQRQREAAKSQQIAFFDFMGRD